MDWPEPQQAELCEALEHSRASDLLETADQLMIDYSIKLTREPQTMNRVDVDLLRNAGFNDRAIHDICCIASYYAFVNRIADGLGVEIEPELDQQA